MSLQVSVVIPTYDRPGLLRLCLQALVDQDLPASAYEIVVADNAGSNRTRSLVEQFREEQPGAEGLPAVHYVAAAGRRGPAAARNAGWRFAHAEVIAFTDDDCRPERRWLSEGLQALAVGYDAVTGRVRVPLLRTPTDYERNVARLATDAEFVTANCFIRCSALAACGGFDERFQAAWREDSDLHFSLLTEGYRIGKAPGAVVEHPVREATWGVSMREQGKSLYNALLYKKYPALYRGRIQARSPYRYYAILAAVLVCIAGMLRGLPALAWFGAGAWVAQTAAFAAARLRGTRRSLSHVLEMLATSAVIPLLSIYWRLRGAVKYRVWFL